LLRDAWRAAIAAAAEAADISNGCGHNAATEPSVSFPTQCTTIPDPLVSFLLLLLLVVAVVAAVEAGTAAVLLLRQLMS
jgi:hypothetical protein